MRAAHRKLDNLTAIVDRNRLQQGAGTEDTNQLDPLADSGALLAGNHVRDGHDHATLLPIRLACLWRASQAAYRKHDQGQGCFVHAG